ncbi:hypothetical protein [Okeania sp. KiyG1]|uniref:DUF7587 domain-containing protein n=1 Tax=Okeania sp. KiyG1 TaxID=2720165 RepID=UPI0019244E1A|nr:hypothetical protein [Okeania sp. KiyG1]
MDRNIVFRGLDPGENPGRGLVATDQNADTTIRQHIAGQKPSPWISASKDEAVAAGKYFKERGYVAIDASQVPNADFVDTEQVLNELPEQGRHRNFVTSDQEVLFRGEIAADAILAHRSSDTEWQWTGRDQNPLEREYNVPPSLRGYSPLSPEY